MMSQRKFAKLIGRSVGYVNKKVKEGVIPLHGPKRQIDPEEAKAALAATADPTRDAQREANAKRRAAKKEPSIFSEDVLPKESVADMTKEEKEEYYRRLAEERKALDELKQKAEAAGVDDLSIDTAGASLNEVKIFKELYLGKMAQLEYRRKSGELVERSEVEREAYEAAAKVKASFLSMPHRLASRFAGMNDAREIEAVLEDEFRHALESLSGGAA